MKEALLAKVPRKPILFQTVSYNNLQLNILFETYIGKKLKSCTLARKKFKSKKLGKQKAKPYET